MKWVVMDSNHRRHRQQIYSLPHLATLVTTPQLCVPLQDPRPPFQRHPVSGRASCRIRTNDPEITNHVLWPTELKRHAILHPQDVAWRTSFLISVAKVRIIFQTTKLFWKFFSDFLLFLSFWSISPSKHPHRGLFPPRMCRRSSPRTACLLVRPL